MQTSHRLLQRRASVPDAGIRRSVRTAFQQPVCMLQARGPLPAAARHSAAPTCTGLQQMQLTAARPCSSAAAISRRRCRRTAAYSPLAMINVDFASPSLVLGIALIGCGVALLQVRNMQREVSRDADIVVAAMISIVGSTLIFQGWRLDPLLLLCQALTTSVAFWYGLETFKLRQQVTDIEEDEEVPGQLPPPQDYNQMNEPYTAATRSGFLPPAEGQIPPWGMQQQQQQQQPQQPDYARWGLPPADQSMPQYGSYFGQQQQMPEGSYAGYEEQYAAGSTAVPPLQQQQYGQPGEYLNSAGYSNTPYSQQNQQQQQYGVPASGYGTQEGWYGGAGVQPLYGQQLPAGVGGAPAAVAPVGLDGTAAVAAAGPQYGAPGLETVPDGAVAPAGYVGDGTTPLPLPPGQRQQQQRVTGNRPGQAAYERVDDWE